MDEMSNKALLIATGLFVTLIITSSVLFILDQIKNIYSQVYETNISLQDRFSEFDEYDNTTKTAVDFLNTLKKYRDDNTVIIHLNNAVFDTTETKNERINSLYNQDMTTYSVDKVYNVTVNTDDNTGITIIKFST